mgnify:CR=1 FL=1
MTYGEGDEENVTYSEGDESMTYKELSVEENVTYDEGDEENATYKEEDGEEYSVQ